MNELTRRDLALTGVGLGVGVAVGGGGSAALASVAQAPSPRLEDVINPELRPALPLLAQLPTTPLTRANLVERRRPNPAFGGPLATPGFVERMIPGPARAPEVRVFVVNGEASGATARPAILFIHGGGYVLGSAHSELRRAQELAGALGCVVVSVDYRLAPETPFPGPMEDCYAGLKWLHDHAGELGVDRSRIAMYGGSAGGGLAAQLAIAARDRGEVPLVFQALLYPMLDDRTASTRKTAPQQGLVVWRPADNVFGWTSYLGAPAGSARPPAGAVPARVENLKGLPPTWIGVGSIDLFAEEDLEYARRLIDAGVPTAVEVLPGGFHGFDVVPVPAAQRFVASIVSALRTAFAQPVGAGGRPG